MTNFFHKLSTGRATRVDVHDCCNKSFLRPILLGCLCFLSFGCAIKQMPGTAPVQKAEYPPDTILSAASGGPVSFETMMNEIADVPMVFVGERHTSAAHHEIQLKILEGLHASSPQDLMVGMEMFAHTYQDVLDEWSAGNLGEDEFLRRTHWRANWKFDFSLYKHLLDFAKNHRTPVVGLNVPFHIPPKIAIGGIDSLSDCERKLLAEEMDLTHAGHRAYIRDAFETRQHGVFNFDFENFYAAQVSWEETMAQTISQHLGENRMLILAGNGHIVHKFGIPERASKRTGSDYRTVMPVEADQPIDLTSADFIWITPAETVSPHSVEHP